MKKIVIVGLAALSMVFRGYAQEIIEERFIVTQKNPEAIILDNLDDSIIDGLYKEAKESGLESTQIGQFIRELKEKSLARKIADKLDKQTITKLQEVQEERKLVRKQIFEQNKEKIEDQNKRRYEALKMGRPFDEEVIPQGPPVRPIIDQIIKLGQ